MAGWAKQYEHSKDEHSKLARYAPKDLTNRQDFTRELHNIESDQTLTSLDTAGRMLTAKLEEVENSEMLPDIKKLTFRNVKQVWDKTNARILELPRTVLVVFCSPLSKAI